MNDSFAAVRAYFSTAVLLPMDKIIIVADGDMVLNAADKEWATTNGHKSYTLPVRNTNTSLPIKLFAKLFRLFN